MPEPERAREANDRLANKAARLHFVAPVPFLCECGDPSCTDLVLLTIEDYHAAKSEPITAPGHAPEDPRRATG